MKAKIRRVRINKAYVVYRRRRRDAEFEAEETSSSPPAGSMTMQDQTTAMADQSGKIIVQQ